MYEDIEPLFACAMLLASSAIALANYALQTTTPWMRSLLSRPRELVRRMSSI